jgi:hypothetical protein
MTELAASLPKARRRKPLPPGFKIALAQVLWCHGGFIVATVGYAVGGLSFLALALWTANVLAAWMKPVVWMPHEALNIWACVHWLRRYWREWRDD